MSDPGQININSVIDMNGSECLNDDTKITNIINVKVLSHDAQNDIYTWNHPMY